MKAIEHIEKIRQINLSLQTSLNVSSEDMLEKVQNLIEENKELKKNKNKTVKKSTVFSETFEIDDFKLVVEQVKIDNPKELRNLVDAKKNTNEKVCVVLMSVSKNKVALVCGVTKNLCESLSAKDVIAELSKQINGTGGGRSDFAQGAGETENVQDFVTSISNTVKSLAK